MERPQFSLRQLTLVLTCIAVSIVSVRPIAELFDAHGTSTFNLCGAICNVAIVLGIAALFAFIVMLVGPRKQ